MRFIKGLAVLLVACALAACGGGGKESTVPGPGGTTTATPSLTVSISSPNVTAEVPATVTFNLKDAKGDALAAKVVTISTSRGLATFAVATVLTDSSGNASAMLQAASSGIAGADEVVATAVLGTTTTSGGIAYQVVARTATISASLSATSVGATSLATFSAVVRDPSGATVPRQLVKFSSAAGLVNFSAASAVTDDTGTASVQVSNASASVNGADQLTAAATVNGKDVLAQSVITVTAERPSLALTLSTTSVTSAAPATVSAAVKDTRGDPVVGTIVTFSTSLGLGLFDVTTAVTDSGGIATARVAAKTTGSGGADFVNASVTLNTVLATDSKTATFSTSSVSGLPTLALAISSVSVSSANPATVTATVLDSTGQPVAGKVVTFSSLRSLGALSVGTALTNAGGQAVVSLAPTNSTVGGADEVVASTSVAGTSLQATQGFQLQASNIAISTFSSATGNNTLSAYGQTELTVGLTNVSVGSPVNIQLTSSCLSAGKATVSPSSFTTTLTSTKIQYKDNGCGATQPSDQLQVIVVGSAISASLSIPLARPDVSSLAFVQASPEAIFVRASGFTESAAVTFEIRDAAGNPLPGETVTFKLLTGAGGVLMEGKMVGEVFTAIADTAGRVSVRVNSGTQPTPVRVQASITVSGRVVSTVSSNLSVGVGLPSQLGFSLSQATRNIEGFNIDGTPNTYQIIASDRSGNPVPAGTSINFVTEEGGGVVESIKQAQLIGGISRAVANFVSSGSRPPDGRITVTAYVLGEESFVDLDGNNVWNSTEPFQDLGNLFKDRNFDGSFSDVLDEFIPLNINNALSCRPTTVGYEALLGLNANPNTPSVGGNTCDGTWSGAGQVYVRRAVETVLSTSAARPLWAATGALVGGDVITLNTSSNSGATAFTRVGSGEIWGTGCSGVTANKQGALSIFASDANAVRFNPVAAGTTVAASATSGVTATLFGSPVPSTTEPTAILITIEFADGPPAVNSGTVTVSLTSPSGLISQTAIAVRRGLASGAACP